MEQAGYAIGLRWAARRLPCVQAQVIVVAAVSQISVVPVIDFSARTRASFFGPFSVAILPQDFIATQTSLAHTVTFIVCVDLTQTFFFEYNYL
jgi:hypothetical protein